MYQSILRLAVILPLYQNAPLNFGGAFWLRSFCPSKSGESKCPSSLAHAQVSLKTTRGTGSFCPSPGWVILPLQKDSAGGAKWLTLRRGILEKGQNDCIFLLILVPSKPMQYNGVYGGEMHLIIVDGNCHKTSSNQDFLMKFFLFSCIFQWASAQTKYLNITSIFQNPLTSLLVTVAGSFCLDIPADSDWGRLNTSLGKLLK